MDHPISTRRHFRRCSLILALALSAVVLDGLSHAAVALERPPQYVAMAFDNCLENTRWIELKAFTQEMQASGKPINFTFFVSGVNFIPDSQRMTYQGPHKARGKADIDFGGSREDISERLSFMHDLHELGGELASHTVGHFHGGSWSAADWLKELTTFQTLFLNAFQSQGYHDAQELSDHVKGFRAPYLETSPGLYTALEQLHYRYDTSTDAEPSDWPRKKGTLWMFPLANLRIVGSGKRTLSMDYNFFASQSGAEDSPSHAAEYQEQMLETYLAYFKQNYAGNRAPIHIGHHFFGYQGGVYNKALKDFARRVCGLPEVRCVTYSQLADVMDKLSPETIKAYQNGEFARAKSPF